DVLDRHVRIAVRELRRRGGSLLLLFRSRLLLGSRRALRADRLNLDLRELRAEPRLPAIARLRLVLADPHLLAQRGAHDLPGHRRPFRRELELPATAEEQHLRMEGLALLGRHAVHEQALALLDAVLLPAE